MKRIESSCLLLMVILLFASQAMAQYTDRLGGNWNNPTSALITNIIMDRYAQRRLKKNLDAQHQGANPGAGGTTNDTALHFRSTGTQLKTAEIANLIGPGNPQVQVIMTSILQEFDKSAREMGKPNDLALALSFFLATNASLYHGKGQPDDPQLLELRETIAQALIEGNALSQTTDRQKQEIYETLVLFTGFALAAYEEGIQSNNSASVKIAQQLAGQNLQSVFGVSPDKINFNNQGLSIQQDASASESRPEPDSNSNVASVASINAGKLVIEFEGNEVRANQMYVGKRIRVNGTVNSIEVTRSGQITLTFHSPAGGFAQTQCYFNKSQSSHLANFNGGDQAVVEGTVKGLGGGMDGSKAYVVLENCIVP